MKRLAVAGLTMLLLWALVPALGELVENALHLALEGHAAHSAPDGDHHDPVGSEHGCSGAVHLCSCCVSLSFLTTHSAQTAPVHGSEELTVTVVAQLPAFSVGGVYHPPRA